MRPDHPPPTHISTPLGTPSLRGFLRSSPKHRPQGFPGTSRACPKWGGAPWGPPPWGHLVPLGPALPLFSPWVGLLRRRAHTNTTTTMSSDTTASVATRPARRGRERGPHPEQEPEAGDQDKKAAEGASRHSRLGFRHMIQRKSLWGWLSQNSWGRRGVLEIQREAGDVLGLPGLCFGHSEYP